jgi:hypothetical protein
MSVAGSASASSKTSEAAQTGLSAATPAAWLAELRRRGHRGQVVPTHRALTRYVLRAADLVTAVAVMIAVLFIWLSMLPRVCALWQRIFVFAVQRIGLHAEIIGLPYQITPYLHFAIPSLELNAPLPTPHVWWTTTLLCVVVFGVTFLLPRYMLPLVYLVRGVLLVQASALAYFAVISSQFVHTANDYVAGMMTTALILISVVPILFAFTYYIFDFGLIKKFALTALTMAHLTLFVPLQLLLHARLLQVSVLFMPLLYIVFGLMLDVLIVIAFYAWGMSWEFRKRR